MRHSAATASAVVAIDARPLRQYLYSRASAEETSRARSLSARLVSIDWRFVPKRQSRRFRPRDEVGEPLAH